MASTAVSVADICRSAQVASRALAMLGSSVKDEALEAIAAALIDSTEQILEANARDLEAGEANGLSDALLDRLALDERRVAGIGPGGGKGPRTPRARGAVY